MLLPHNARQSSDEELERFEVALHKSGGKGIGITIAGLADADTGSKWCNRSTWVYHFYMSGL